MRAKVFLTPEDDHEQVTQAFLSLFPFDLEEQRVPLTKKRAEGFNNRKLVILELALTKDSLINEFVRELKNNLSEEQVALLLRQKNRLDHRLHYFIRLDKEKLMNNTYFITEGGNCFHLEFSVAAHPKSEENAWKVLIAALRKTL